MITIDLEQNTPEWLRFRLKHLGSSDSGKIMNLSPFSTPYKLWSEKLQLSEPEPENSAMREGKRLEPLAREYATEILGMDFVPLVCQSEEYPMLISSMDGVDIDKNTFIEIKCSNYYYSKLVNDEVDPYVYCQMQHQYLVTGLKEGWLCCFNGHAGKIKFIPRDDEYIDKLLDKEMEFYEMLQTFKEPPLTDKDWIDKNKDYAWGDKFLKYSQLKRQLQALEVLEKEYRQELIEASGGKSCKGFGGTITKSVVKGRVDYNLIEALKDMDLEPYRKPSSISYRITLE